jgi:hypothetical protein
LIVAVAPKLTWSDPLNVPGPVAPFT